MTDLIMPETVATPSPNWNERPPVGPDGGVLIDTVVLHYTGMTSATEALERLCLPESEVSAHFLIEEDGKIHQLVHPDHRAWHAGVSCWQGRDNLNHTSIGIELVNPGHEFGYCPFPEDQVASLVSLLKVLARRYHIPQDRYLGHSDIAPGRKQDPGELFPWQRLAGQKFGLTATYQRNDKTIIAKKGMVSTEIASLNKSLRIIGYPVTQGEVFSQQTHDALQAFQQHWRQEEVSGCLDSGTLSAISSIEKQIDTHKS